MEAEAAGQVAAEGWEVAEGWEAAAVEGEEMGVDGVVVDLVEEGLGAVGGVEVVEVGSVCHAPLKSVWQVSVLPLTSLEATGLCHACNCIVVETSYTKIEPFDRS